MNAAVANNEIVREKLVRLGALAILLILGGLALAGPYGLLSWGENVALLEKREHRITELRAQRDELRPVGRVRRGSRNEAQAAAITGSSRTMTVVATG